MPTYKLHYFNFPGRAELARLVFAAAGVHYEYITYDREKDWPTAKSKFEFGKVPVLEVDGVQLNQSKVIAEYLAREFGFMGKTNMESSQAHALVDTIEDSLQGFVSIRMNKDLSEAQKEEKLKEFFANEFKVYMENFEKYLRKHISASGYAVGNNLTYGDLALVNLWQLVKMRAGIEVETLLKPYALLTEHNRRIRALPRVKEFFEKESK